MDLQFLFNFRQQNHHGLDFNAILSLSDFQMLQRSPPCRIEPLETPPASCTITQFRLLTILQLGLLLDSYLIIHSGKNLCALTLNCRGLSLADDSQTQTSLPQTAPSATRPQQEKERSTTGIQWWHYPPSPASSKQHGQCSTATPGYRRSAELTIAPTSETFAWS